jgi:hypothetical protein
VETLSPAIVAVDRQIVHPAMPPRIALEAEPWVSCNSMVCVKTSTARAMIRNKIKVGRWMSQARENLQYYRDLDKPSSLKNK